ncbi:hypothetical protein KAT08_03580 [Candidatus Babeliales bacterium]|nr:hypothetical protein [Candidatus Babeliales bacterium]
MNNYFKFLFISFILCFSSNVYPTILIAGDNLNELKSSLESLLPSQEQEANQELKLGFADIYLKKVGDKYDKVVDVIKANQRLLKLSGLATAFIYGKYINPDFFPNLISKTASVSMGYLSTAINAILKGAMIGAWENKGMTTKIVGGLLIYGIVTNAFNIGLKAVTEYVVAGSKKDAEYKMADKYGVPKKL